MKTVRRDEKSFCRSRHHRSTTRVRKYRDIFENIKNIEVKEISDFFDIFDRYRAFAHTLLKYKNYYQIVVCVCALHTR